MQEDDDLEHVPGSKECLEVARDSYRVFSTQMARNLSEYQNQPEEKERRVWEMKINARRDLEAMPGSERDAWASAWCEHQPWLSTHAATRELSVSHCV